MDDKERYEILKQEVDTIQIQMGKDHGPWYSKPSNIVSVVALIFSFGTTFVSYKNAHEEDIRSNHREAMALIQRITKLPIENFELIRRYESSPQGQELSGAINQENILLATQANSLIERYPNAFTATEYFSVAFALANSNITDKVPHLFNTAIEKAETASEYNAAARAYAGYLYTKGDFTEGKKYYEMALAVWNKFPEKNRYVVNSTDLITLLFWSRSELFASNTREAEKIIMLAKDKLAQLQQNPMTQRLAGQVNETVGYIEQAKLRGAN